MKVTLFSMTKGTRVIDVPADATELTLKENGHIEYTVSLQRNGEVLRPTDTLQDGDVVAALPKLKGGN